MPKGPNRRTGSSVSIHAPARGATHRLRHRFADASQQFQSTPPHGERPDYTYDTDHSGEGFRFQSTPPHGERRGSEGYVCPSISLFQSTPPHGERLLINVSAYADSKLFQSTPPHGERPNATAAYPQDRLAVSIHAPARGATTTRRSSRRVAMLFQSTPPHGERQRRPQHCVRAMPRHRVSIHAPARGATVAS